MPEEMQSPVQDMTQVEVSANTPSEDPSPSASSSEDNSANEKLQKLSSFMEEHDLDDLDGLFDLASIGKRAADFDIDTLRSKSDAYDDLLRKENEARMEEIRANETPDERLERLAKERDEARAMLSEIEQRNYEVQNADYELQHYNHVLANSIDRDKDLPNDDIKRALFDFMNSKSPFYNIDTGSKKSIEQAYAAAKKMLIEFGKQYVSAVNATPEAPPASNRTAVGTETIVGKAQAKESKKPADGDDTIYDTEEHFRSLAAQTIKELGF